MTNAHSFIAPSPFDQQLERIAVALEALVEQGKPAHATVEAQPLEVFPEAVNRTVRNLASITATPVAEPLDGGIWVLTDDDANALPVGVLLGRDGGPGRSGSDKLMAEVTAAGPSWFNGPPNPKFAGNFHYGRCILNPEILGEFHPTVLKEQEAYDAAPAGTLLEEDLEARGGGVWYSSEFGKTYGPGGLCAPRRVLRWGPAVLKVGGILRTAKDYERAPIGTKAKLSERYEPMEKRADGWHYNGQNIGTPTPSRRTVVALP